MEEGIVMVTSDEMDSEGREVEDGKGDGNWSV